MVRAMKKTEQYNVLGELSRLSLVNHDLLIEVSNTIEANYRNESLKKTGEWMDLAELVAMDEKAFVVSSDQMLNKLFGNDFLQNKLFTGLAGPCVLQMIQNCSRVHINPGETVYYEGQVSTRSRPL